MTRSAGGKRLSNPFVGLIVAIIIAGAFLLAFVKDIPFVGGGTEVRAVFNSAQNVRVNSPVRIAGVEVGKVTGVEPLASAEGDEFNSGDEAESEGSVPETGAVVTMELTDDALPLKSDAAFKLRPRLFLEGNLFVDLQPGSPSTPEADLDQAFGADHTANSVQLDQVLTGSFQADARRNLQILLGQFGIALIDGGGAESFRTLYKTSKGAFKNTSLVNEAVLGTQAHDLSNLIKNLDKVVRGLGADKKALQGLVSNLSTVAGSFAAEDAALEASIAQLPDVLDQARPAFANLNASFPSLRSFSRAMLPGTRSTPATLDKATPFIRQLRLLAGPDELRGLAADLRRAIPDLARLSSRTVPFLEESRALANCFNQVIIPWADDEVKPMDPTYPHDPVGRVYEETGYGLVGIGGESRSGDANGQYIRVVAGGGTNMVQTTDNAGNTLGGITPFPLLGAMPAINSSAKTRMRPNQPCENQDQPNLESNAGNPPSQTKISNPEPSPGVAALQTEASEILTDLATAAEAAENDEPGAAKLQRQAAKRARSYGDN